MLDSEVVLGPTWDHDREVRTELNKYTGAHGRKRERTKTKGQMSKYRRSACARQVRTKNTTPKTII